MADRPTEPPDSADKSLGEIVSDVSEKASLLVREEIELAKAEVVDKASKLGKGAGIGAAAGVFAIFGVVFLLSTLAWLFNDLFDVTSALWLGFLIVTLILFALAAVAGYLAYRFFKRGAPPTPEMAIEEAKRTREAVLDESPRHQLEVSRERGRELQEERSD